MSGLKSDGAKQILNSLLGRDVKEKPLNRTEADSAVYILGQETAEIWIPTLKK